MHLTRKVLCPALFAALISLASGEARSQGLTITVTPNPIIIGNPASYSISGTFPFPVQSYYWEYRSNDGVCLTIWGAMTLQNDTATQSTIESKPGTFDVRCTIQYQGNPFNPNPPPSVVLTSVTIAPPNGFRVVDGTYNVATGLNYGPDPTATSISGCTGLMAVFQLQVNGVDVGPYISGQPQEYVTAKVLFGMAQKDDPGWSPTSNDARFTLGTGGRINDFKVIGGSTQNAMNAWGGLKPFLTRNQAMRILIPDTCGNQKIYSLNSVNIATWVDIDPTKWDLAPG